MKLQARVTGQIKQALQFVFADPAGQNAETGGRGGGARPETDLRTRFRKCVAALLVACMTLSYIPLFPASADAAVENKIKDAWTATFDGKTTGSTGTIGTREYVVIIISDNTAWIQPTKAYGSVDWWGRNNYNSAQNSELTSWANYSEVRNGTKAWVSPNAQINTAYMYNDLVDEKVLLRCGREYWTNTEAVIFSSFRAWYVDLMGDIDDGNSHDTKSVCPTFVVNLSSSLFHSYRFATASGGKGAVSAGGGFTLGSYGGDDSDYWIRTVHDSSLGTPTLGGSAWVLDADGTSTIGGSSTYRRVAALVGTGDSYSSYALLREYYSDGALQLGSAANSGASGDTLYIFNEVLGQELGQDTIQDYAGDFVTLPVTVTDGKMTGMTLGAAYTAAANAVTMKNGFNLTLENATYNQDFTVAAGNNSTAKNTITTNGATFAGSMSIAANTAITGNVAIASGKNFNLNIGGNSAVNTVSVAGNLDLSASTNSFGTMDVKVDATPTADSLTATGAMNLGGYEFNLSDISTILTADTTNKKNTLTLFSAGTLSGLTVTGKKKIDKGSFTGQQRAYVIKPGAKLGTIDLNWYYGTLRMIVQGKDPNGETDIWDETEAELNAPLCLDNWLEDEAAYQAEYGDLSKNIGTFAHKSGTTARTLTIKGAGNNLSAGSQNGIVIQNAGDNVTFKNITFQDFVENGSDRTTAITNAGTINLADSANAIVFQNSTGADIVNNGTANINGAVAFDKGITGTGTTNINVDTDMGTALLKQGTVTVGSSANLTVNAGQLQAATVEDSGNINLGAGDLPDTTIISGSGKVTTGGNVNASASSFTVAGGVLNDIGKTLTLTAGGLGTNISGGGTTAVTGTVTTDKQIANKINIESAGNLTNTGTISGAVVNEGTFATTANGITGGVANNATMVLTEGMLESEITGTGALEIKGAVVNNKGITQRDLVITNGSLRTHIRALDITNGITNNAENGLVLAGTGTVAATVSGTGSLKIGIGDEISAGDITAQNAISQNITVTTANDKLTIAADNLQANVANSGEVQLNAGTLADGATITGGKITTGGNVSANVADLKSTDGITNENILTLTGTGDLSDNIKGTGKTVIGTAGTVANITNTKTIENKTEIDSGSVLTNKGTITNAVTNNGTLASLAGKIEAEVTNNGTYNTAGIITHAITGTAGTLNLKKATILGAAVSNQNITAEGILHANRSEGSLLDTTDSLALNAGSTLNTRTVVGKRGTQLNDITAGAFTAIAGSRWNLDIVCKQDGDDINLYADTITAADSTGILKLGNIKYDDATEGASWGGAGTKQIKVINGDAAGLEIKGTTFATSGYKYTASQDTTDKTKLNITRAAYTGTLADIVQNHTETGTGFELGNIDSYCVTSDMDGTAGDDATNGIGTLTRVSGEQAYPRHFAIDGNGHTITAATAGNNGITVTNREDSVTLNDVTMKQFGTALNIAAGTSATLNGAKFTESTADANIINNGTLTLHETASQFDKGITGTGTTEIQTDTDMANAVLQQTNINLSNNTTLAVKADSLKGQVTSDAGANVTLRAGTLDLGTGNKITGGKVTMDGDVTADISQLATNEGINNAASQTFTLNGTGTLNDNITGKGTTAVTGTVTIADGKTIENAVENSGTITAQANAFTGGVKNTNALNLTNGELAGNITGNGTTTILGTVTNKNAKTIENALVNNGHFSTTADVITGGVTNRNEMALTGGTLASDITGSGMLVIAKSTDAGSKSISQTQIYLMPDTTLAVKADSLKGQVTSDAGANVTLRAGTLDLGTGNKITGGKVTMDGDVTADISQLATNEGIINGAVAGSSYGSRSAASTEQTFTLNGNGTINDNILGNGNTKITGNITLTAGKTIENLLEVAKSAEFKTESDTSTVANGVENCGTVDMTKGTYSSYILNYGGATLTSATAKTITNSLGFGTDGTNGVKLHNIQTSGSLSFLMNSATANSTIATATGEAYNITGAKVVLYQTAKNSLSAGDKVTLIQNTTGVYMPTQTIFRTGLPGDKLFEHKYNIYSESDALVTDYLGKNTVAEAKALSEGQIAGAAALTQANDMTADATVMAAQTAANAEQGRTLVPYAVIQGAYGRYNTGSHVDLNTTQVSAGLAKKLSNSTLAGFFIEGGNGRYTSYNEFDTGNIRADGDINYFGGGIFARHDFKTTGKGNAYIDAAFGAGRANTDYATDYILGINNYRYDTAAAYLKAHATVGYDWKLQNKGTITGYAKYLWTRQNGDTVQFDGTDVNFDAINSSRLRAGFRYTQNLKKTLSWYGGLAYEYEFDMKAGANSQGLAIAEPDLIGASGMAELGLKYKPAKYDGLTFDASVQGFTGKRDSIGVKLGAWYEF